MQSHTATSNEKSLNQTCKCTSIYTHSVTALTLGKHSCHSARSFSDPKTLEELEVAGLQVHSRSQWGGLTLQRLRRQYLYFCTRKESKLSTCCTVALDETCVPLTLPLWTGMNTYIHTYIERGREGGREGGRE